MITASAFSLCTNCINRKLFILFSHSPLPGSSLLKAETDGPRIPAFAVNMEEALSFRVLIAAKAVDRLFSILFMLKVRFCRTFQSIAVIGGQDGVDRQRYEIDRVLPGSQESSSFAERPKEIFQCGY